jgi:hypothetical protein
LPVIIRTIVDALNQDGDELGQYEYERPLDSVGKDCLRLWMSFMELLNPGCSFEVHNLKDGVGEKFSLGPPPEGDLF